MATAAHKLLSPFGKRLVLAGVRWKRSIRRAADDMTSILGQEWAPTFNHVPLADGVAAHIAIFVKSHLSKFDFGNRRPTRP
eukprot:4177663-Alexandrium_andersonii.AAC.1